MAENVVGRLIGLVVTLATLAGIYFFIVGPILDTTNDTIDRAFEQSDAIQRSVNESLESSGLSVDSKRELGRVEDVDLSAAIDNAPDRRTKRLLRCIDRADGEIAKISRCQQRFF